MVRILLKTVLFLALAAAGAAPAADLPASTALRQVGGALVVDVSVNGEGPYAFRLDTAAHETAVYRRLIATGKLDRLPGAAVVLQGAGGRRTVPRYALGRLDLAGQSHRMASVAAIPMSANPGEPLYGVVGQDFLLRFAIRLDIPAGTLTLLPRRSAPETSGYSIHTLSPVTSRLVTVEATVAGQSMTALVDTGAAHSLINPAAADALGQTGGLAGEARGIDGAQVEAVVLEDALDVRLDDNALGTRRLAVAALPLFRVLRLDREPAMVLGADLLGRRRFILDWQRMRLLLADPAAP